MEQIDLQGLEDLHKQETILLPKSQEELENLTKIQNKLTREIADLNLRLNSERETSNLHAREKLVDGKGFRRKTYQD